MTLLCHFLRERDYKELWEKILDVAFLIFLIREFNNIIQLLHQWQQLKCCFHSPEDTLLVQHTPQSQMHPHHSLFPSSSFCRLHHRVSRQNHPFLADSGCWGRLEMRRRNIGNKIGGKLFSIVLEELLVLPRSSWLSQTSWHSEDWSDHHCAIPNSTDVRNFLHSRDRVWVWIRRDACSHCANPKHKRCKCVER